MKLMIEIKDGMICNVTATDEVSIFIVYHDTLSEGDPGDIPDTIREARRAQQPDVIYWDEADFDEDLEQALADYNDVDVWELGEEART